ncbi:MAG TPA: ROK family protein [Dietzia timorensis]|uniref:ROK family protein n=1 Tax=Dietzia timorensis TaxID=499555 RepID=A0A921JXN2_9ACTN|nr:ROK family protein [Dietzia timorensis]HJE90334.1 ROK family protein [Dietzia timorensis]
MGRPSPSVFASDRVRVLAVNPEVDVTTGAVVGLGGRVFARAEVRHRYPPSPLDVVAAVSELIDHLAPGGTLWGIGVAIPGLVNEATGAIVVAPHLGWRGVPLAALLSEAHGLRVVVGNDANCGALAESLFGAGRGCEAMVYLNGGASGIGGASIMGGSVMSGSDGYAGEFGHTLVNTVGGRCDCGATGCLETEVRRAPLLAALGGVAPTELSGELLRQVPREGPAAVEADRQLQFLGIALRTVVNVMNPRRILLGGFLASMVQARGFEIIHAELSHALPGGDSTVEIVTAELGSNILAVGAAQLVLRHIIDDPLGANELAHTP